MNEKSDRQITVRQNHEADWLADEKQWTTFPWIVWEMSRRPSAPLIYLLLGLTPADPKGSSPRQRLQVLHEPYERHKFHPAGDMTANW